VQPPQKLQHAQQHPKALLHVHAAGDRRRRRGRARAAKAGAAAAEAAAADRRRAAGRPPQAAEPPQARRVRRCRAPSAGPRPCGRDGRRAARKGSFHGRAQSLPRRPGRQADRRVLVILPGPRPHQLPRRVRQQRLGHRRQQRRRRRQQRQQRVARAGRQRRRREAAEPRPVRRPQRRPQRRGGHVHIDVTRRRRRRRGGRAAVRIARAEGCEVARDQRAVRRRRPPAPGRVRAPLKQLLQRQQRRGALGARQQRARGGLDGRGDLGVGAEEEAAEKLEGLEQHRVAALVACGGRHVRVATAPAAAALAACSNPAAAHRVFLPRRCRVYRGVAAAGAGVRCAGERDDLWGQRAGYRQQPRGHAGQPRVVQLSSQPRQPPGGVRDLGPQPAHGGGASTVCRRHPRAGPQQQLVLVLRQRRL
jgi:hypothetical protein